MDSRKLLWANNKYSSVVCQIDYPIRADCLQGFLATMIWLITPTDIVSQKTIIVSKFEVPGNCPVLVFEKNYETAINKAYENLVDRLEEEHRIIIKKHGWKIVGKGIHLPEKKYFMKELDKIEIYNWKYLTKYNTKTKPNKSRMRIKDLVVAKVDKDQLKQYSDTDLARLLKKEEPTLSKIGTDSIRKTINALRHEHGIAPAPLYIQKQKNIQKEIETMLKRYPTLNNSSIMRKVRLTPAGKIYGVSTVRNFITNMIEKGELN